ncbi:unnamed protein product [Linum trigynum]|uniref:Secreted protein n=1 Tax=Linum trigynum TaxID=586398 RepID=A0AAV2D0S5_9ROSI
MGFLLVMLIGFFGYALSYCDVSVTSPLPFGPLITTLLLRIRINLHPFCTITPSIFLTADDVMDLLEIAVEGENGDDNNTIVTGSILLISSDSDSDDSAAPSDDDDAPELASFAIALQTLYGSDSSNEALSQGEQ